MSRLAFISGLSPIDLDSFIQWNPISFLTALNLIYIVTIFPDSFVIVALNWPLSIQLF
jgi:hypothetical protein